jgi:hypothetical protein
MVTEGSEYFFLALSSINITVSITSLITVVDYSDPLLISATAFQRAPVFRGQIDASG